MHVLIAPNAFKGSLPADQAAHIMADGLKESGRFTFTLFPVADGGNDTMKLLTRSMKGDQILVHTTNVLGEDVRAAYGWVAKEKTALIGLSEASGLHLIANKDMDPLTSHTYGTGILIKAALDKGARKLIIGIGGSATTDGGTGILAALGTRYLDGNGKAIRKWPIGLKHLQGIDISNLDPRLQEVEIIVLCDVKNRLIGEKGAAKVFAPQKGADDSQVALLEEILQRWNKVTMQQTGIDMSTKLFGGAAGGVGAALAAYTSDRLVSGITYFLDVLHFDQALKRADFVITGEGSLDAQTLEGKGPFEVAVRAKKMGVPVVGFAGKVVDPERKLRPYFDQCISINPAGESLENAIKHTSANLKQAVRNWAATYG